MLPLRLPDFSNVVPTGTASLKIPKYLLTLQRIMLRLGGTTFTKAMVSFVRVKIGARIVWSVETQGANAGGTHLDRINQYKGLFAAANFLSIDLSDRDFASVVAREIGGIDMSKLAEDVFLEVGIAGATAPALNAVGFFTPPQGDSEDPGQLVRKLLGVPFSFAAGGKYQIPFEPRGSLLQRIFVQFNGTTGTGTANGNITQVEVKKNGLVVFDPQDLENRLFQQEYRKVPQAQQYAVDFVFDNNPAGGLVTADARALEFNLFLTAGETGIAYFEVLDAPNNL